MVEVIVGTIGFMAAGIQILIWVFNLLRKSPTNFPPLPPIGRKRRQFGPVVCVEPAAHDARVRSACRRLPTSFAFA
jgi:hypothetical protein